MTNKTVISDSNKTTCFEDNGGSDVGGGEEHRFLVRDARREDCQEILRMIQELAEFEEMADQVEITLEQLEDDGFGVGHPPRYFALVAEEFSTRLVVGYSIFLEKYSTWKGRFLWIEDLYVHRQYRKLGIGDAIFRKLTADAERNNLARIEWTVLNYNEPALKFYQNLGAFDLTKAEAWHLYRLKRDRFRQFLQSDNPNSVSIQIE